MYARQFVTLFGKKTLAQQVASMPGLQAMYLPRNYASKAWQDSAGTTPVTAVEQAEGLVFDESPLGNHASQTTAGFRPKLSAKSNLVLNSRLAGGGAAPTNWTQTVGTGTSAPNGTINGNTIYRQGAVAQRPFIQAAAQALAANSNIALSAYVDTIHSGTVPLTDFVWFAGVPAGAGVLFFVDGVSTPGATAVTAGTRVIVVCTSAATAGTPAPRVGLGGLAAVTADVSFSRPQLEYSAAARSYQWTTDAVTYDTQGFPLKTDYDGSDDVLNTTFPVSLGSACTVVRSVPGYGSSILTAQTISTSYADSTDYCGLAIFNRALTSAETTIVTAWANKEAGL